MFNNFVIRDDVKKNLESADISVKRHLCLNLTFFYYPNLKKIFMKVAWCVQKILDCKWVDFAQWSRSIEEGLLPINFSRKNHCMCVANFHKPPQYDIFRGFGSETVPIYSQPGSWHHSFADLSLTRPHHGTRQHFFLLQLN